MRSKSVYNMRSLWAKINNLGDNIIMRGTDLCFLTEIWQKQENKRLKYAIEEMLPPGLEQDGEEMLQLLFLGEDFLCRS